MGALQATLQSWSNLEVFDQFVTVEGGKNISEQLYETKKEDSDP